jgi:hypothetical protein
VTLAGTGAGDERGVLRERHRCQSVPAGGVLDRRELESRNAGIYPLLVLGVVFVRRWGAAVRVAFREVDGGEDATCGSQNLRDALEKLIQLPMRAV